MKTTYTNKMVAIEETKIVEPVKKKQKFFFPTHNITIEASSYDCAMRKLEDLGFVEVKEQTPCEEITKWR